MARKPIRIKHPGALHRQLGVPQGQRIPDTKIQSALHSEDPALRKRANFARNAKKWKH